MDASTKNGGLLPSEIEMNKVLKEKEASDASPIKSGHGAKGLSVWQATLFIVGEVAGSGVLALPNAILGTGWVGLPLLVYFGALAGYSGVTLGRCWIMVEARHKKYAGHVHSPYQMIAMEAYGVHAARLVNFAVIVTQFGAGTVIVVLISGILKELLASIWDISICNWSMIIVAILIPMSWLGTPKDFWILALGATISVIIAAIALFVQCFMDIGVHDNVHYPEAKFKGFSLGFGAMLFGFGGSAVFPTIQNDMKDRTKFPLAAAFGFASTLTIYAPVAFTGYFVFGNYIQPNLAVTVSAGPLRTMAQVLLVLHLFCASMTVINPVFQEFEGRLGIDLEFGWRRCLLRTGVMLLILFVGESVPSFGKILDLIGGSTNTLLIFIFPAVFYMKLANHKNPAWKTWTIPLHEKVLMWEIIFVGTIGAISSTISAIWEIATPDALSRPCYLS